MGRPAALFVLLVYKVIRSVRVISSRATALDGLCRACGRAGSILLGCTLVGAVCAVKRPRKAL